MISGIYRIEQKVCLKITFTEYDKVMHNSIQWIRENINDMAQTKRDEVLYLRLCDSIPGSGDKGQAMCHQQVPVPLLQFLKQKRNAVSHILC